MQVDVKLSPGGDSFVATVDGRHAGRLELVRRDGVVVYPHTKVEPAYEGNGVGSALVRTALDAARAEGAKVVPLCWFVREWIDRHPDYADLVQGG
ncbi:GNAT family N-acetyltransferase [Streptosporangium amethystogenes]|uniref:GNAT family N-acetyltransferase n=1 Tax=Streptosporangium amethystogenes TaxID=2002 RepID=UPI0004CC2978|nr:GNAT family N-acetyltransferase [Streptosporangium amethystogenes]